MRLGGTIIVLAGVVLIVLAIYPAWFRFHADAWRHRKESSWPTTWLLLSGVVLTVGGALLRRG